MFLDSRNEMIKQGIKQHGILVHTIETFSYTTGMANYGLPEIIITTMSQQTRGNLCNYFFKLWREKGVQLKDIEPMFEKQDGSDALMRFVSLADSEELYDEYVAQTVCYYEAYPPISPLMFVHLQFGDNNDIFPDSPMYDSKNIPQKTFAARISN
nr:DUF4262 domain-containing protein [Vibrio splendidus]MCC4878473.1 DUF4262 domain-containing protein [Vibrio splendidus]